MFVIHRLETVDYLFIVSPFGIDVVEYVNVYYVVVAV